MVNLIRYPGSKAKLVSAITALFPPAIKHALWSSSSQMEYREAFFGAGAVGFQILRTLDFRCPVWLNDKDPHMVALWRCVRECPEELLKRCDAFIPSTDWFYKFKEEDGREMDFRQAGFRKLALHRMSFSGLGAKAGGPIGGKDQENARYTIHCRWNPSHIKLNVSRAHKILSRFPKLKITNLDFEDVFADGHPNVFQYLDPPYFEKGPELYVHSMSDHDHLRLARTLRETECQWLLSYDDHPTIRELYKDCHIQELHVTYTTAVQDGKRPKNHEVVIYPRA